MTPTPPKYLAVAEKIRASIREQDLSGGDRLPGEKRLAADYGVNHLTVRRALKHLAAQGDVHTIPSRGTYVGPNRRRRRQGNLVGLVFPDEDPFFFRICVALESCMRRFNYLPVPQVTHGSPAREQAAVEALLNAGVAAVAASPLPESHELYRDLPVPAVFFDNFDDSLDIPYVITDDYRGSRDAVEHLLELGHRRVAHIGGSGDQTSIRRAAGYRDAMTAAGLPVPAEYVAQREYSRNWGYHAALELARLSVPPTALFCGNDAVASGALRYLRSAGVRCPEDVSVIGYSNSDLSQDLQLSSVHQPVVSMAEAVWRNLSLAMQQKRVPHETRLETMLIVRKTTGRCPRL